MRKLIVSTFLSLDGVMQGPGGDGEDNSGGFDQGGWSVNYWDERMGEIQGGFMAEGAFDLLLGRKTYEVFAGFWPHASDEEGGRPMNKATKYVVSTTLTSVDWQPSVLIGTDVVGQIRRLKGEDGPELQVHGSAQLIQTLIANDLADEFRLWIFPLTLGKGKRLFGDGTIPAGLRLTDTQVSTTGVIVAIYERAGAINHGTFAHDQPATE
jgi:dihydrofolate reductase